MSRLKLLSEPAATVATTDNLARRALTRGNQALSVGIVALLLGLAGFSIT
jgi:hypothetical protein